jgi:hypothetical protein
MASAGLLSVAGERQTDRQTSCIKLSIETGILRSSKGSIHASAGLGAVLQFFRLLVKSGPAVVC